MRVLAPLLLAFVLLAMALPVSATSIQEASTPKCIGVPCDVLNIVCGVVKKGWTCVKVDLESSRCMGEACDAINRVCDRYFGVSCVG